MNTITPTPKKILMTPEKAKELLAANIKNRRISEKTVRRYADDMKAGRWKQDTYEFIKISRSGAILDGQHRLSAVVAAKTSVVLDVVYNVSDQVFDVLDTGKTRNGGDVFKIAGISHDSILPSIIQTFVALKSGANSNKFERLTNQQILAMYNTNDAFWQLVARRTMVWYEAFGKIIPPSVIGGFYAYFYDINQSAALLFTEQLCSGMNVSSKPIGLLRKKLIEDRTSVVKKMPMIIKWALIIKAWNAFRKNDNTLKILKHDMERDAFPKAI